MKPGSIIVDLAAERGGNAELTKAGEIVEHNGVRIMGKLNLPGAVPVNASSLYARNLLAFVEPMIAKETKDLAVNWDDELVKGTLIARDGTIVNTMIAGRVGTGSKAPAAAAEPKATSGAKPAAKKTGGGRQPKGEQAMKRVTSRLGACRHRPCGDGVCPPAKRWPRRARKAATASSRSSRSS